MKTKKLLLLLALPLTLMSCSKIEYEITKEEFDDITNPTKILLECNYTINIYQDDNLIYTCMFDYGMAESIKYTWDGEIDYHLVIETASETYGNGYVQNYYSDGELLYTKNFETELAMWYYFYPYAFLEALAVDFDDFTFNKEEKCYTATGITSNGDHTLFGPLYFESYTFKVENKHPVFLQATLSGNNIIKADFIEHGTTEVSL